MCGNYVYDIVLPVRRKHISEFGTDSKFMSTFNSNNSRKTHTHTHTRKLDLFFWSSHRLYNFDENMWESFAGKESFVGKRNYEAEL